MLVYFTKNKDNDVVNKSSSGGFFTVLANHVISNSGVVFGAVFDKEFNVEISYTESDFSKMLGSKYVKSSVKKSFSECKKFLDDGRLVLYTGTPCQIIGLKAFLKKEYSNLITMDIICHGSPVPEIWQNYLRSFCKEISSVNFRDKRISWEEYNLTIKFKDGTEFSEKYSKNKYMKLFLDNKILSESCYKCKSCKNSKADFTVGDAWSVKFKNPILNDHRGTSCIILRNDKSASIFKTLQSNLIVEAATESYLNTSYGYTHNFQKPADADRIKQGILNPKIAMVTIPGHQNIGNTLQALALQSKIKEILPYSNPIIIDQRYKNVNDFFKKNLKYTAEGFNSTYDIMIVGSDQIWSDGRYISEMGVPFEDRFLINSCNRKIVYAASFGKHILGFTPEQRKRVHESLEKISFISTREISGTLVSKLYFGCTKAIPVLDPTMLYDKDFYLNAISEKLCTNRRGIFAYILDMNESWNKKIKEISDKLKQPILPYNKTVENFIHNMNSAACIITDSYHGSVFSIIFNNPFVTLRNIERGNDRFDDLSIRFKISNRFISNLNNMDFSLLKCEPNLNYKILEFRSGSLEFLSKALKQF